MPRLGRLLFCKISSCVETLFCNSCRVCLVNVAAGRIPRVRNYFIENEINLESFIILIVVMAK